MTPWMYTCTYICIHTCTHSLTHFHTHRSIPPLITSLTQLHNPTPQPIRAHLPPHPSHLISSPVPANSFTAPSITSAASLSCPNRRCVSASSR